VQGGSLVDRGRRAVGLGYKVEEDEGFVEWDQYILERPILFCLLVVYMKQCQLWHQNLGANPGGASPNSERRRVILSNKDTENHHHPVERFVGGDLEVQVSWIVA